MRIALTLATLLAAGSAAAATEVSDHARELADNMLLIDTHIDVPYRLEKHFEDISKATPNGDFDYPRADAGGLDVAFMSIYIPSRIQDDADEAQDLANRLIDTVEEIVADSPDKFTMVYSTEKAEELAGGKRIGFALGMENGAPIRTLEDLQYFYDRGIRYITLTHGKSNHISDSSYDHDHQWHGLSEFGKELVPAMNKLGVMVDISHVSDEAFWQALEISEVPLIATHSSARRFTEGFERNMSDDMIKALAEKGGVIQINFGSTFISARSRAWSTELGSYRREWLEDEGLEDNDVAARAFSAGYAAAHPFPFATLDDVLDHFDHVVKIAGIDHVGIGSDYDGVGDSLPVGLKSVADYPRLVQGLLDRGYSEDDIQKILGGNALRVWKATEDYAASH
ncbi:MAG TPA: dipeptidase [Gammaproteobacteria bacterium]